MNVDPHDQIELLDGLLQERRLPPQYSGATDQDVETTKALDGGVYRSMDRGLVGDIGFHEAGAATGRLDERHRLRRLIRKEIGNDEVAAGFRETNRGGATKTTGTTGYECNPIFMGCGKSKSSH